MSHNAKRPTPSDPRSPSSAAPKRRRVSRACDACRSAKDKCDGAKPRCQRCTALRRHCTYLNPGKRRGIRTGYLRAIELALALLLEALPACEGVLLRALAERGAGLAGALLDKENPSPATEALLGRWQRSDAFRAIERLISRDEVVVPEDTADGDSAGSVPWPVDTPGGRGDASEGSPGWMSGPLLKTPTNPGHDRAVAPLLELPPNFRHYLDVYFASTHSWLPVVEEEAVTQLAASYPLTGLRVNPCERTHALHSELWSAMALGAALDPAHRGSHDVEMGSTNGVMGPSSPRASLYNTARALIPLEDGTLATSHVRSLLLLSLVKLSQDETNAAWLLIGHAVRLLLGLPKHHGGNDTMTHGQHSGITMACFVLDTLVSMVLGNPSHMRSLDLPSTLIPPFNSLPNSQHDIYPHPGAAPTPEASLFQQYKFARVLSQHLAPQRPGEAPALGSGATDLIHSLEPPFHFCNTLVHGGISPRAPGAVLAQAGFLTASILLSPTPAPRLIQSLVDVVGQYVSSTDTSAPPPLLTVYLELATGDGRAAFLPPDEKERTAALMRALKNRLSLDIPSVDLHAKPPEAEPPRVVPQVPMGGMGAEQPLPMPPPPHLHGRTFSHAHPGNPADVSRGYDAFAMHETLHPMPGDSRPGAIPHLNPALGAEFDRTAAPMAPPGMPESYPMDYDAILDELSSLDYVDSNEPDPQFMANLGFAPGCELNDMFGGHFGLV